jgi:single-strand DNA-binding protein
MPSEKTKCPNKRAYSIAKPYFIVLLDTKLLEKELFIMTANKTNTAEQKFFTKFSDVNSLTFSGRLGKDPEFKVVGNGNQMASFSVASTFVSGDEFTGIREETTWLNVVAWGDDAKIVKRMGLKKGDHVTCVGRLSIRRVANKVAGQPDTFFTQLVLDSCQKNDRKNDKRNSGAGNGAVKGQHVSSQTIADRHDNALNPDPTCEAVPS